MSIVLKTPSSGSVTLSEQDTPNNVVVTIPSINGSFVTTNSDGKVGIGLTNPDGLLHSAGDIISQSSLAAAGSFFFQCRKSRGTVASPTVVVDGDTIGGLLGLGYDGSSWIGSGRIDFRVTGVPSTGNIPTAILFRTGTTSNAERMRIESDGNVLIGATSLFGQAGLNIQTNSGGQISLRHSGSTAGKYWRLGPDSSSSNFILYNQSGTGAYIAEGGTGWTANSDERLKTDLVPIKNASEKVASLRPVTGRYKTDKEGTSRAFLIAQDVQKAFPEAVHVQDDEQSTLGLQYTDMIPLLTAAIQELKSEFDDYKLTHP